MNPHILLLLRCNNFPKHNNYTKHLIKIIQINYSYDFLRFDYLLWTTSRYFYFQIGHILESSEYQSQIVPCVVKMFSSTDRATRLKLLQQIETLSEHLDPKTVNDQVFQPLVNGFQDTNPTIREHTVKVSHSLYEVF